MNPAEVRLLAAMPLHAITSVYGTEGLRERLLLEAMVFSVEQEDQIGNALDLAEQAHHRDKRQREPYINHLLRVAIRIVSSDHYGVKNADMVMAGLLHDILEDHANYLAKGGRSKAADVLRSLFGIRVAEDVLAVTNPEFDQSGDVHQQYRDHVTAKLRVYPRARVVKMSDFTDNAIGLHHTTGPRMLRLARKYAPMVSVMQEVIMRQDTPLSDAVKAKIKVQLNQAALRFAIIQGEEDAATAN